MTAYGMRALADQLAAKVVEMDRTIRREQGIPDDYGIPCGDAYDHAMYLWHREARSVYIMCKPMLDEMGTCHAEGVLLIEQRVRTLLHLMLTMHNEGGRTEQWTSDVILKSFSVHGVFPRTAIDECFFTDPRIDTPSETPAESPPTDTP